MGFLTNITIRRRLTAIIMATSAVSVLLTALIISLIGMISLERDMLHELRVSASIVGDRNAAALMFNDDALADSNLRVFSVSPAVEMACLYDKFGALFAGYVHYAASPELVCAKQVGEGDGNGDWLEVTQPILRGGEHIGSLYIRSNLDAVAQYIRRQSLIALAVTLAVMMISYILALRLQHGISAPVLRLAETARAVADNKDYNMRARPFVQGHEAINNELVLLTNAFNAMLQEIGEREAQLKQQNMELEKARDEAEAASRTKSQFLANVSHELRTPLNAIIGFSSILMNQLFGPIGDAKYVEYAKDINESGNHLLDIINDILDLSRADAGNLTLHYEEIHVGKTINKCVTLLAEQATKKGVGVSTDIPRHLPPLVADRLRFMQIVLNVLSNAIKFTPTGGKVYVGVETRSTDHASEFVITVRDNGIGMSSQDIEKAFQSFGQVDSGLNRRYEGTGLGLPLTRKLLELHHGGVEVESQPGVGTLVTILIPAFPPKGYEGMV